MTHCWVLNSVWARTSIRYWIREWHAYIQCPISNIVIDFVLFLGTYFWFGLINRLQFDRITEKICSKVRKNCNRYYTSAFQSNLQSVWQIASFKGRRGKYDSCHLASDRTRYFKRKPDLCMNWRVTVVAQTSASLSHHAGMALIQLQDTSKEV